MIVYTDIVSGDEIISDSWTLKEIDDVVYEVDCAMQEVGATHINTGANPSAEEAEESLQDDVQKEINVVGAFKLQLLGDRLSGDKGFASSKAYHAQLKAYLKLAGKALLAKGLEKEEIIAILDKARKYYKDVIEPNFDNYDFYAGQSLDPNGL
ncbi:hypothetical protein MMC07_008863 [Pseudocyphellaria aurata]|nr:hypothetical protein [Pseudocyphellaria aurata]